MGDVDFFDNIASAQECALLCASDPMCKSFYHVKDPEHKLYKHCRLTKWDGKLDQLVPNDCCDSGSACSFDDMTAGLKTENKILKQRLDNNEYAKEARRLQRAVAPGNKSSLERTRRMRK